VTEKAWKLLVTLSDAPSAESLARVLASEGITVRVVSEAHLFGQAAPCRLFVQAAQAQQAHWTLTQRQFSDEELTQLATTAAADSPQTIGGGSIETERNG
jgi:hypothetical protein